MLARRGSGHADGREVKGEIRIGLGSCCVASGSDEIRDAVKDTIDRKGLNVKTEACGMCGDVSPGTPGGDCSHGRGDHALFKGEGS